jgi:hypothetical protein
MHHEDLHTAIGATDGHCRVIGHMKYVLVILASYASVWYLVGTLIRGRLADIAEGLRHRPDAPPPGQYLREVEAHARRAHRHYSLIAGSMLALVLALLCLWLG